MDRTKVLVFGGFGLFIFLTVIAFMYSGSSDDSYDEDFLTSNREESFTLEDMMKSETKEDMFMVEDSNELVRLDPTSSSLSKISDNSQIPSENLDFYSNEDQQIIRELEGAIGKKHGDNQQINSTSNYNKYLPKEKPAEDPYKDIFNGLKKDPTIKDNSKSYSDNQTYTQQQVNKKPQLTRININELTNNKGDFSSYESSGIIPVKTYENKAVKNGSRIKLITTKSTFYQGINIPQNTIITGAVKMNNNILEIIVQSIKLRSNTISCNLQAYGDNGLPGLTINNNVIKKEALDDATNQGGSYIRTPIGEIGTDAFKKGVNDNSVMLYDNTPMILK